MKRTDKPEQRQLKTIDVDLQTKGLKISVKKNAISAKRNGCVQINHRATAAPKIKIFW